MTEQDIQAIFEELRRYPTREQLDAAIDLLTQEGDPLPPEIEAFVTRHGPPGA